MAMKTPEKQILPIAPSYPDLNALTRWAGDLTRTLAQNLSTIARKANDENAFTPIADLDMQGFSITNLLNIGMTGTITFSGTGQALIIGSPTGAFSMTNPAVVLGKRTSGFSETIAAAAGAGTYRGSIGYGTTDAWILRVADIVTDDFTFTNDKLTIRGGQLNLPHGAAPGAPANGDLWSTTAAFFARINGNTRTLAVLEAQQTWTDEQFFKDIQVGATFNENASIELGYTGGTNRAAFIDFHSSATAVDYDYRMIVSSNTGTVGTGSMTMQGTGGLTIDGPVTISAATAGQIVFPATQNASAGANTLDDYEEGTFTPRIDGTTTAGAGTYTTQLGTYTKIGRTVHATGWLVWTAHTGTGNMVVEGLPFTSGGGGMIFPVAFYISSLTFAATYLEGFLGGANTKITLRTVATGAAAADLAMDTAATLVFNVTYVV